MQAANEMVSRKKLWGGRILSGFIVLFLVFDSVLKFFKPAVVLEAEAHLGLPDSLTVGIGILLLACTVLYIIPRTSILGAVLLTGYLGGAVATHLRVGDPLFSTVLFPIYVGLMLWGGIFLRQGSLGVLIPSKS